MALGLGTQRHNCINVIDNLMEIMGHAQGLLSGRKWGGATKGDIHSETLLIVQYWTVGNARIFDISDNSDFFTLKISKMAA
jgi:hypothetical protein